MLTVKQIEAAKPKEKPYRLLDGNGLYLYVPVKSNLLMPLCGKRFLDTSGRQL